MIQENENTNSNNDENNSQQSQSDSQYSSFDTEGSGSNQSGKDVPPMSGPDGFAKDKTGNEQ